MFSCTDSVKMIAPNNIVKFYLVVLFAGECISLTKFLLEPKSPKAFAIGSEALIFFVSFCCCCCCWNIKVQKCTNRLGLITGKRNVSPAGVERNTNKCSLGGYDCNYSDYNRRYDRINLILSVRHRYVDFYTRAAKTKRKEMQESHKESESYFKINYSFFSRIYIFIFVFIEFYSFSLFSAISWDLFRGAIESVSIESSFWNENASNLHAMLAFLGCYFIFSLFGFPWHRIGSNHRFTYAAVTNLL